ncbi:MAG: AAA family ATPase, partial [Caldilineaceae bacterium]|nr:AAA family ATPase [Caldilineaceae bacterium]
MNPKLSLFLLGEYRITIGDQLLTKLTSRKAQALLCYLAVTGRAHARAALAGLLWPDVPESNARVNLRKELTRLRQFLRPYLIMERDSVSLNWDANVWLDVRAFETWLEAVHSEQSSVDHVAATLARIDMLYAGDFLEGFYVLNAPAFEEWVMLQRGRLRELMLQGLQRLSLRLHADGQLDDAITATRRILALEPWREDAHCQLMALLAQNGQRGAALAHFERCREQLKRELDVEPSAATLALVAKIRAGTVPQPQVPQSASLQSRSTPVSKILHPVITAVEFPLIGREQEWQLVQNLWHNLQQPHFLCFGGEAGIGKTRLTEELVILAEREKTSVARARSHALQGQLAYGPITDWLRSAPLQFTLAQLEEVWLTELARILPELLVDYSTLVPPKPMNESWQRTRFFDALCHAFTAGDRPLLLVVDDLQWADVDTLEWIQYLVECATDKLLVVGTVRADEIDTTHPLCRVRQQLERHEKFTELLLSPLVAPATAVLARQVAQQQLADDEAEQLFQETAGNPLFVIETMRATQETPVAKPVPLHLGNNARQEQRFVPAKIYSVIQTRLAQLSPAAQTVAQIGATIGRRFDVALLVKAAGLDEDGVFAALDELWQRRVIVEVDAMHFDFSHDRIRDVAYAEISPIQRRRLHQSVVNALEAIHRGNLDLVAGQMATHCRQAGLIEKAVGYANQAAKHALQLSANEEAIAYLENGLTMLDKFPPHSNIDRQKLALLI